MYDSANATHIPTTSRNPVTNAASRWMTLLQVQWIALCTMREATNSHASAGSQPGTCPVAMASAQSA